MAGLLWYRSYMDSLANTNGYYPDIHAGHADRVTELTLDAPYLIRETPAGYNQQELMELVGGSVAWNQLCEHGNFDASTGWSTSNASLSVANNVGTFTATAQNGRIQRRTQLDSGHVYMCGASIKISSGVARLELVDGSALTSVTGAFERLYVMYKVTGASALSYYPRISDRRSNDWDGVDVEDVVVIDLTSYLNPTIADYVYSLEQATAGSGVAWLKMYDLIDDQYHAYSAPTLQSVEASAHVTKDANDTIIATYPLDSDLVLRGIPKLTNGVLSYDGDTYEWDGTVTRKYGTRAYQAGDESLTDAITDGTNTVYKLITPTTESADPFTAVQTVEDGGTEEFVTSNNIPVGNVSVYRRA